MKGGRNGGWVVMEPSANTCRNSLKLGSIQVHKCRDVSMRSCKMRTT
jgi:hypothetical protein